MHLSFETILRVDSRKSCCPIAPKLIVYGFLAGFNLMLFIVEMTLYESNLVKLREQPVCGHENEAKVWTEALFL